MSRIVIMCTGRLRRVSNGTASTAQLSLATEATSRSFEPSTALQPNAGLFCKKGASVGLTNELAAPRGPDQDDVAWLHRDALTGGNLVVHRG